MTTPWSNINNTISGNNTALGNKPLIAISIPYTGKVELEWIGKSYLPLCHVGVDWCNKTQILCKVPSIPVARSTLVDNALNIGVDYIFFFDSDMIFEQPSDANTSLSMLYQVINKDPNSKEGKIVSGLYRAKQKQSFDFAAWLDAPNGAQGFVSISKSTWTGNWLEVDVCGLGCCLIDIRVFKNIPKPFFRWEMNGDISEDFYFNKLAKKYGYSTHVFTDVKLSHLGMLKIKSDGSFIMPEM